MKDCCTNQQNLGSKTIHNHGCTTTHVVPGHCKLVLMSFAPVVINEKACKIIPVRSFWLQFRKILKHMPNSLRADVTKVNYLGINSGTSLSVLLN